MLHDNEKKSLSEGSLLLLNKNGIPEENMDKVWFVWYQLNKDEKYKILLKTFTTKRERLSEIIKTLDGKTDISGIGVWNMNNGRLSLLKEKK